MYFRSHLVTVPPGPLLSEALMNSPILVGEDGTGAPLQAVGFEFGVDPNEDPELALVIDHFAYIYIYIYIQSSYVMYQFFANCVDNICNIVNIC